jgi:cyclic 2,3-diphosphoglycerate synthetase
MTRVIVLVDGEHHPAAVRAALEALRNEGNEIAGAVFCGGTEKVDRSKLDEVYGVEVAQDDDLVRVLGEALERWRPEVVNDLTDEPILSPAQRFELASHALAAGVSYHGADFELSARKFERIVTKPSIRVFATGKRTGKTAVASALARHAAAQEHSPLIVAVGRGGPNPPRLIEAGTRLDAALLLEWAEAGHHAGSDYVEDAMTSGVTTIGCVRVGGGLAGATVYSNVLDAARMAEERSEDLVIFEGSGASFPDVAVDAGVLCIPATLPPADITSYLGAYRLLLADLAVVTMAEEGPTSPQLEAAIRKTVPDLDLVHVAFRPEPLSPVTGRKAFFFCTAPPDAGPVMKNHLEREYGCEIVGMSHRLSDRATLKRELEEAPSHDLVLTELKAGAVDVVVRESFARDKEVVFVNNILVGMDIEDAFDRVIALAGKRGQTGRAGSESSA